MKKKEESVARRGDKLLTDRDGSKSFDGRTIEYVFNAPHLKDNKPRGVNTAIKTQAALKKENFNKKNPDDDNGGVAVEPMPKK